MILFVEKKQIYFETVARENFNLYELNIKNIKEIKISTKISLQHNFQTDPKRAITNLIENNRKKVNINISEVFKHTHQP